MLNWIEKFFAKRIVKRLAKKLPALKEKGVDFIEKEQKKLFEKIEMAITQFIEKYSNK